MRAEVRRCARLAFDAASRDILQGMKDAPARPRVAGRAIPRCNGDLRSELKLVNRAITSNPLKVELTSNAMNGGEDYPLWLNTSHRGFSLNQATQNRSGSIRKYYQRCGESIPAPGSNWRGWWEGWLTEDRWCQHIAREFTQSGVPVTVDG